MIRESIPSDAPVLRAIQRASLASPWPQLLESALDGGVTCFVATTNAGEPVGYMLVLDAENSSPRGDDPQRDSTGSTCYVAELAIAPDHRREGHGSALLAAIAERTDASVLLLTARTDDAVARAFYESHGFDVIKRLPDHYDDESGTRDGVLLSKPLDE